MGRLIISRKNMYWELNEELCSKTFLSFIRTQPASGPAVEAHVLINYNKISGVTYSVENNLTYVFLDDKEDTAPIILWGDLSQTIARMQ